MKLSYFILLIIFCVSCGSDRKIVKVNHVLLSFESNSCFGKCEVFKFILNENKTIEYEGDKNVEKIGKYKTVISDIDFNDFEKLINKVDAKIIDSVYTSNSTDLHLRILNLNMKSQYKKILLFDNVPNELKQIEKKIYYIIEKYKNKF